MEFALESRTPLFFEFGVEGFGSEHLFHGALTIVEIAPDARHKHVVAVLRAHLQPLHFRNALVGIEHRHLCPRDVLKAFQRRLARIAARRGENKYVLFDARQRTALFEQMGKQRERHILERAGGAVEKFEDIKPLVDSHERGGIGALERRIRRGAGLFEKIPAQFVQIFADDERGAVGIVHLRHRPEFLLRDGGESFGNEQAAVFRQPLHDRLCARHSFVSSCADEIHILPLLFFPLCVKAPRNRPAMRQSAGFRPHNLYAALYFLA